MAKMKIRLLIVPGILLAISATVFMLAKSSVYEKKFHEKEEVEAESENEMSFVEDRARYEFDMVKNPVTGKIPTGIYEQEIAFAKAMPERGSTARNADLNSYLPAGPNNI